MYASIYGKYFAASLLAVLIHPLWGFSVTEAVESALQHNDALRQQALLLENAQKDYRNSWNSFLPSISIDGSLSNSHSFTPQAADSWSWSASGGLSLAFSSNLPLKFRQKRLAFDTAQTVYTQKERDMITEVTVAYYTLIALKQNTEILKDNLKLAEDVYNQNLIHYNNGLTSELNMLRSQYAFLQAGPALKAAESAYASALDSFRILIGAAEGEPESDTIPVLYELELPPAKSLVSSYSEKRFDIRLFRQALDLAELERLSLILERQAPSLRLSESLRLSPARNAFSESPGAGGSFSVSVSLPLDSLIPGSAASLTISAAANAITSAQIALDAGEKNAAADIALRVRETDRLYESLSVSRVNLSITERAYELALSGYNYGVVSQTDLETTRQDMTAARQAVLQAEVSYLSAVYALADSLALSVEEVYELWGKE